MDVDEMFIGAAIAEAMENNQFSADVPHDETSCPDTCANDIEGDDHEEAPSNSNELLSSSPSKCLTSYYPPTQLSHAVTNSAIRIPNKPEPVRNTKINAHRFRGVMHSRHERPKISYSPYEMIMPRARLVSEENYVHRPPQKIFPAAMLANAVARAVPPNRSLLSQRIMFQNVPRRAYRTEGFSQQNTIYVQESPNPPNRFPSDNILPLIRHQLPSPFITRENHLFNMNSRPLPPAPIHLYPSQHSNNRPSMHMVCNPTASDVLRPILPPVAPPKPSISNHYVIPEVIEIVDTPEKTSPQELHFAPPSSTIINDANFVKLSPSNVQDSFYNTNEGLVNYNLNSSNLVKKDAVLPPPNVNAAVVSYSSTEVKNVLPTPSAIYLVQSSYDDSTISASNISQSPVTSTCPTLIEHNRSNLSESISRCIVERNYSRMYQLLRDFDSSSQPDGGHNKENKLNVWVAQLFEQEAFSECFQVFRIIKQAPSTSLLQFLTQYIVRHTELFINRISEIWIPFNKHITSQMSAKAPLCPSFTDSFIQCFAALNALNYVWNTFHACHQSGCLNASSLSSSGLICLIESMLSCDNGSSSETNDSTSDSGGFIVCLSLIMHLIGPQLSGKSDTPFVRKSLLMRIWLRCLEEKDYETCQRLGGSEGSFFISDTNITLCELEESLDVVRSWISEQITLEKFNALASFFWSGRAFLPKLSDFLIAKFLLQMDPLKSWIDFVNICNSSMFPTFETPKDDVSSITHHIGSLSAMLAKSFSERRHWQAVVRIHETVFRQWNIGQPSFLGNTNYIFAVLEAFLRLKNINSFLTLLPDLQNFTISSDVQVAKKQYSLLKEAVQLAEAEKKFSIAIDLFATIIKFYSEDTLREISVDTVDVFNDLLVKSCSAGNPSFTEASLNLSHQILSTATLSTRFSLRAFALRILLTESIRQKCYSSNDASGPNKNTAQLFFIAERGFKASVYRSVEMINDGQTRHVLSVPSDATCEELQIILTSACKSFRIFLLKNISDKGNVLELCNFRIVPYFVGNRDLSFVQQYKVDNSEQGVLTRMESVLKHPLFLPHPIAYTMKKECIDMMPNELYYCVYYIRD